MGFGPRFGPLTTHRGARAAGTRGSSALASVTVRVRVRVRVRDRDTVRVRVRVRIREVLVVAQVTFRRRSIRNLRGIGKPFRRCIDGYLGRTW